MRLNGSAVNARALNGVARLPVRAEGEAASILGAELTGHRTRRFSGDQVVVAVGDFKASARRFSAGTLGIVIDPALQERVCRSGQADAVVKFDSALFYTRIAYGFGSALIDFDLDTKIGVVYFEGDAPILPFQIEMGGTRRMKASGDAVATIGGELSGSAVRRALSNTPLIEVDGESEGSHIHDGILYVGAVGDAVLGLEMADDGMKRQAHVGSLDMGLLSDGGGLVTKHVAGEASCTVGFSGDFKTQRMLEADAIVSVGAEVEGRVFVRGEGETFVLVEASGNASKTTFASGQCALDVDVTGEAERHVQIGGAAESAILLDGEGARVVPIYGKAVLALFEETEGYINIQALDIDSEVFNRPASNRLFSRGETIREWRR